MVEGAPLLRAYRGKTPIQGSNPCLSAKKWGPDGPFLLKRIITSLAVAADARRRSRNQMIFQYANLS